MSLLHVRRLLILFDKICFVVFGEAEEVLVGEDAHSLLNEVSAIFRVKDDVVRFPVYPIRNSYCSSR